MKTIKLLLAVCAFFIANTGFSYTLIINKSFLAHNPSHPQTDYNYASRGVSYEMDPMDPTVVVTKTVDIFCEGNGNKICPNQVSIPTEPSGPPTYLTVAAINAAQNLFDTVVGNYVSTGSMTNSSGTIGTPDGLFYSYSISWTSSAIGGDKVVMTFASI